MRDSRRGLSLVELLVVVGIVAVLIGLLLPAVQKVREAANAARCRNNLKQLGLAVQNYELAYGKLPPAGTKVDDIARPVPTGHAWGPYLLPYLERDDLTRAYDFTATFCDAASNQRVINTSLPIMVCPSAPRREVYTCDDRDAIGTASAPFIYSAAPADYAPLVRVAAEVYGTGGLNIPVIDPRYPAELSGMYCPYILPKFKQMRSVDVSDGLSHTVLIAEVAGRPDLWDIGQKRDKPFKYNALPVVPGGWGDLFTINNSLFGRTADDAEPFGGTCFVNCGNDHNFYAFHPGGANAVFGDGSVRFVPAAADPYVVASAVTARGGEVPSDF